MIATRWVPHRHHVAIRRSLALGVLACTLAATAPGPLVAAEPSPSVSPVAPVVLPAGAQMDGGAETLPAGIELTAGIDPVIAERDGILVAIGVKPSRGSVRSTVAAVRDLAGRWRVVAVDDGRGIRGGPAGSRLNTGVWPSAIVAGPNGFVAAGDVGLYPGNEIVIGQSIGLVWTSADGRRWRRVDLRPVVGSRTSFRVGALVALPRGGYLLAGSAAALGFDTPSTIVVLASADGRRWRKVATLDGRWAMDARGFHTVGDRVLLHGAEYACESTSANHRTFSVGAQARYWVSDDGTAWIPVPTDPMGVIASKEPGPTTQKACPRRADIAVINDRFATTGAVVGTAAGQVIAMSGDGTRVAASRDLARWTVAELPGVIPGGDPPGDRGVRATTVVADPSGSGIALLSLERPRAVENRAGVVGHRVLGWRSTDDGASWEPIPPARPILLQDGGVTYQPLVDGSMLLVERTPAGPRARARLWRSAEGRLREPACTPGRGADCSSVTLTSLDLAGQDLAGISLVGAVLDGVDLTDADLAGADLRFATIVGSLRDADLTRADLGHADVSGDVAGAVLTGADLSWADLSGHPDGTVADAKDLDLREATLEFTSLARIDLTGARFGRRGAAGVYFWYEVICPDGQPSGESSEADPCRLGRG